MAHAQQQSEVQTSGAAEGIIAAPSLTLPKGGGAIRGIGEKFAANPVTGTASMTVPIAISPGRGGFGPELALSYDSGAGNGVFGLGWSLGLPSITRKTDRGLPRYDDAHDADVFILSGAEDLVPVLKQDEAGLWSEERVEPRTVGGATYRIRRYRPRVEGLFARIERWTNQDDPRDSFWRSIAKDNITSWYGRSSNSRIADPEHPERIFSWLLAATSDRKGNCITYQYKAENVDKVDLGSAHEQHRGDAEDDRRAANRYLKRIFYGNHVPYIPKFAADQPWPEPLGEGQCYFEVVFDYGEHNQDPPAPQEGALWDARHDPFSSYRSTFEIRTHRLCQRVLMFHHIPDELGGQPGYDGLVRSTDFTYAYEQNPARARTPNYSKLVAVMQRGYECSADGCLVSSLPPVEWSYSEAIIQTELRELGSEEVAHLPVGVDGAQYRWIDLDGEGMSGVLTEQAGAWFYQRNLSPTTIVANGEGRHIEAKFAPLELVGSKPVLALAEHAQFLDLAGDGRPDVVQLGGTTPGFYERTTDERWATFVPFGALPNVDWNDPNLRFVDLDGDGHADVLISEQDVFAWHRSLGERGFDAQQRVPKPWDEQHGPQIVFADGEQSVYLADMSGDGLTDLVRIRNGEVCYWPNLGYGCFGAKVTMDGAPMIVDGETVAQPLLFDHADRFDQRRVRLADIDGTGTTDILYLHHDGVHVYFNQSGNEWSPRTTIPHVPPIDDFAHVQTLDLLGNGTACLVWSSPLPGDSGRPLRYLDLLSGQKPHLLRTMINNLGAETTIEYAPSTRFYLEDRAAGKPWTTKLPFPVHCVERVTLRDKWRGTTLSTTYSYHHGYFDGSEREFRGFGRVEQTDVEDYGTFERHNHNSPYVTDDQRLYQPPVKTVTWYHTGAVPNGELSGDPFRDEYFPRSLPDREIAGSFEENELPEPDLRALDLSTDEWREALRACKGMLLRQEVYELDLDALVSGGATRPVKLFSTAYHNCDVRRLQPRGTNQHAVFHVAESEAITFHYELDLRHTRLEPDPRVAHTLHVAIDDYGNIQQSVQVVYPRVGVYRNADLLNGAEQLIQRLQGQLHMSYTETHYTDDVLDDDDYYLRLPCEVLTYELTGIRPNDEDDARTEGLLDDRYLSRDELLRYKLSDRYQGGEAAVAALAYHLLPTAGAAQRRLVEHTRTLFFALSLDNPLELGKLSPLGLVYESYKLTLTEDLLDRVFGDKLTASVVSALGDKNISGYLSGDEVVRRFGDNQVGHFWRCAGVVGFAANAAQHFYLPERYIDPFGNVTTLEYDARDLYIRSSTDELSNRIEVTGFDFRVLAPRQLTDINNNLSEVRFDVLGMPAVVAVRGKGAEADELDAFNAARLNPTPEAKHRFFVEKDYDVADAKAWLGEATARHVYYFGEVIDGDTTVWGQHPACACGIVREQHARDQADSAVQSSFEYQDGTGNVLVKKIQAEPEPGSTALRWIATGRTILNNKGNPVKQYEPYFSPPVTGHHFDDVEAFGVSPVIYYDAVGRVIRTDLPDGSWSSVEFTPWDVRTSDQNDTVMEPDNGWYSRASAPTATPEVRRAARSAAEHAHTPTVTALDSLGREVVRIVHNRMGPVDAPVDEYYVTFTRLDAENKPLWVQDARGQRVMQYITPPLPDGVYPFDDPNNLDPQEIAPCYDIAGNLLFQHSPDAGERWMLNDAAGKSMFGWNSRGFTTRVTYDGLQRPTGTFVVGADPANPAREVQTQQLVYGEEQNDDRQRNLRGKLYEHFDPAGMVSNERYDFKGNLLRVRRRLAVDYKTTPDWSEQPALEAEVFSASTRYDALNRPSQLVAPHNALTNPERINITQPVYNAAGLLESVHVWLNQPMEPEGLLDAASANQQVIRNINYNAKGQRMLMQYGNGSETSYHYDPDTFRLEQLKTVRTSDGAVLQHLQYTYDPVGNIVQIRDDAQDRVFHNNQCVLPGSEYRYDALYRLVGASGREHKGNGEQRGWDDRSHYAPTLPNDCQALQNYVEIYRYDAVGNIMRMQHHVGRDIAQPGQVISDQRYQYALDSNRLLATSLPGDPDSPPYAATQGYTSKYSYDEHGNITATPHLPTMEWNFADQLSATATQVVHNGIGETTYYVYDASGQRVRKITERQANVVSKQRMYLHDVEIYREYNGGVVTLERKSLHVMDDKQRVALVETQTVREQVPVANLQPLVRYQIGNHLGSVALELDHVAAVISYEEYTPYGSTAYCAGRSAAEVSLKRYRYTGKERDEETGLSYHGARYYAPWLGRWTSCDPSGVSDGVNMYRYCRNNPLKLYDPDGKTGRNIVVETSVSIVNKRSKKLETVEQSRVVMMPEITIEGTGHAADDSPRGQGAAGGTPSQQRVEPEQLRENVPWFSFFFRVPSQYARPYQAPPANAPTGLNAIRQLNGQPAVGVANFSRDIAPGTSVENLTMHTVQVINGAAGVAGAAGTLEHSLGPPSSMLMAPKAGAGAGAGAGAVAAAEAEASGFGDLTKAEVKAIQAVVDEAGRPLEVVGSAAKGTRRNPGTNLPFGKGTNERSDIDYAITPSSSEYFNDVNATTRLPDVDPRHGLPPTIHSPSLGPSIRFSPGEPPVFIPGAK